MNLTNGDYPATPLTLEMSQAFEDGYGYEYGLTKREAFAMAAMQGLLANSQPHSWSKEQYIKMTTCQSLDMADALLKELSK